MSELRTIRDLIRWGASEFGRADLYFGHGTDNAVDEAVYLVSWVLKLSFEQTLAYRDALLTAAEREQVAALLKQRVETRKPAAYLTGEAWFCGLRFEIDERVLVPRSPIAELIEQVFQPWAIEPPEHILDMCSGSGCIGIACASVLPDARVDLVDISPAAIELGGNNITLHGMDDRVSVIQSDLFEQIQGRRYDLIVTNPPYVPTEEYHSLAAEYHAEPELGLEAGVDGLVIVDRLLASAADHLTDQGMMVCEVGSAAAYFVDRYPELPVFWPEFERGGDGVFVVTRDDLVAWKNNR